MAEDAPATEAPGHNPLLRILKWIAIGVGILLLVVVLAVAAINTAPGRAFLVRQANGFSTASGLAVKLGRIDGSLYGRMTLVGLEVRDTRGPFLTSPALTLDWRPLAYAVGKADIRLLSAREIRFLRTPELIPQPSDPDAPLLPDLDVTVGRLAIERLIVEPAVTGKRHIVRIVGDADIADGRARLNLDAAALREAGAAGGDRIALRLDAVPDANRLQVAARVEAPAGGLVDSYAALGKPIVLAIGGRGDWANWNGALTGTIGGAPIANLALAGRNGTFRARGRTLPGAILTGPAARLVGPALDLDLIAALGERRADVRLAARSAAFALDAQGLVDLANSRLGNFRIAGQLLRPGAIAENVRGRDVAFRAVIDGPFATPVVAYDVSAAAIGFGEMGIEGLRARGRATIDADRILVPVAATARRVTGLNAAAGGLLTNLSVNGDLAYSGGRVLSDNLRLRSDRIEATAIVIADIGTGTYTGAIKGRVNDYQVDGLGRINLTTDAELVTGPSGGFGIKGRFRVATRTLDNASVRDFLGGNAIVTGDVGFSENAVATLSNLRVTAPGFRVLDGRGSYRPDGRIAFTARAVSSQYGPVAVDVSGTATRPVVRLRAARPNVGVQLTDVVADIVGTSSGYQVRARGGSPYGPFSANLLIGTAPALSVDIRQARFAGIDFAGRIVQTAAGPFAGSLTLNGSGLNGRVQLAAAGANQRADVFVNAANASIPAEPAITIGTGTIRATAILYPNAPSITADVRLANVRQGELVVTRAQGRIRYQNARGTGAVTAAGTSGVPFDIAAQAAFTPERIRANARGTANGIAFRLAAPADIVKTASGYRLDGATVVIPQGQIRLAGEFGATTRLNAALENLDLSLVQAFAPGLGIGGKASGAVDFTLPSGTGFPTANARIAISRFTRTSAATVSEPVDVAVLGTLSNAGGDLRAVVRRRGAAVGRFQARLTPAAAAAPWSERLLAGNLSGGIRYNGPAEVLWSLSGITGQELSGPIAVAADFGGRLDRPTLNGVVRASALRYENQTYGTVIDRIAIDGRFTQSRLEIVNFTGRAGSGGVRAAGFVGLDAASGFPIGIEAVLDRAQLARSDALGATVSGTINVTNSAQAGALIRGDLRIPEARYQIIRQGAAEVAELEGVRRKGALPAVVAESGGAPSIWKLDLRIRADERLYVSGMGLESEWRSDLRVGGTSATPSITGELEVVRGTYSFAGKRFELTQGRVDFVGGALTDPNIAIAAETTNDGVTVIINIAGRAQNPQITFTSSPVLPQDEVLSRLLFGESVASLSPTQALQLASALNGLRGSGGGGLNPLGKLRSATGIDRLRILGADKTAGRGTALAAGQYISNDIYVEVITDARGFTATQLEIALSKSLSLLSATGSFGGSSVNLRYSKDY